MLLHNLYTGIREVEILHVNKFLFFSISPGRCDFLLSLQYFIVRMTSQACWFVDVDVNDLQPPCVLRLCCYTQYTSRYIMVVCYIMVVWCRYTHHLLYICRVVVRNIRTVTLWLCRVGISTRPITFVTLWSCCIKENTFCNIMGVTHFTIHILLFFCVGIAAVVAQWVTVFAPEEESWVFESIPLQTYFKKQVVAAPLPNARQ